MSTRPPSTTTIAWGKRQRSHHQGKIRRHQKQAVRLICRTVKSLSSTALQAPTRHYTKKFRIVNELASENLFIHQLLIRPTAEELAHYGEADFTIIAAPGFKCIPEVDGVHSEAAIMIDYEAKLVVICRLPVCRRDQEERILRHELSHAQGRTFCPCTALPTWIPRPAKPLCSSACPAPARPPFPPTRTASSSATTSTAGLTTASSTLRAAAMQRRINLDPEENEPEIYNAITLRRPGGKRRHGSRNPRVRFL